MAATSLGQGLVSASEADERGMGSDDEKGAYSILLAWYMQPRPKMRNSAKCQWGINWMRDKMTG